MALQKIIHDAVTGLGYELVEVELTSTGLLRVTIDLLANQGRKDVDADVDTDVDTDVDSGFVVIEDCEKVSRQLSYLLTVEEIQYKRLEVSSPGLDRPLNKANDFERFAGELVKLRLIAPVDGRRNFEGVLQMESPGQFALEWEEEVKEKRVLPDDAKKAKKRVSNAKRRAPVADVDDEYASAALQEAKLAAEKAGAVGKAVIVSKSLSFVFEDVEKANLVAQVEFSLGSESQDEA